MAIDFESTKDGELTTMSNGVPSKNFNFDVVFSPQDKQGLVEANVNNMNEVWEVLQTGNNARAVSSTKANEHSN
ncbi:hypothetical protein RIF29_20372 [Crotalaria pallida]|uniref:Uncharacterized protein n=1 Tax=Crotalaria pallida TaxID=3830 RepID=A0AAN9F2U4_CROPI